MHIYLRNVWNIVKQCKTIVTFDTIPESKILDASDLLILSNLQKPWTIACVISTDFESKDKPTQMTTRSFTIVDFITYRKSIHFELICKDVHK